MNRSVIQYLAERTDPNIPNEPLVTTAGGVKSTKDPIKGIVAKTDDQPEIQQPVEKDIPKHSEKLIPKTTISK
jgi:hypothetical protein